MSLPSSSEELLAALPELAPLDDHNRELLSHVHPREWRNPTPDGRYNMVVIGAGTAGLVTAAGAAGLGARVALIERRLMGGDCLNVGCVPSKALIRAARAVHDVREAGRFGVEVDALRVDFSGIMERMRRLRARISPHDSARRFRDLGVDVYLGSARFTAPDRVEVEGQDLRFARACIATGARATLLPIPGLEEANPLTNETVFSLTELPRRLAVIGAGPIGCELAQSFARFGSEVTVFEVAPQILIREDEDAAQIIEKALLADDVKLLLSADIQEIRTQGGEKHVVRSAGDGVTVHAFDEILLSGGRTPNVEGLGLEAAGVDHDTRRGVVVDDRLRTTNRRIFAAGDVCSPYRFTHVADALARIVIGNALFFGRGKSSSLTIPWCTYTDPEIAHVGLRPDEAREKGIEVETFSEELAHLDRAILDGEEAGFLKVYTRKGKDRILGATLVARHAGEMISELTLAMQARAGLGTLARTIHPYPTQAEVIKRVGDSYNRTRLTPRIKALLERILRWRR